MTEPAEPPVDPAPDTAGFYRRDPGGELLHAPNFVYAPGFTLERDLAHVYDYPIGGWTWHDSAAAAAADPSLAPGWEPAAPPDPTTFDNPALDLMEPT